MKYNNFDAVPFRFEFSLEEVSQLVAAVIVAQVSDEQFIKEFSAENPELCARLQKNLHIYEELLNKLRHPD